MASNTNRKRSATIELKRIVIFDQNDQAYDMDITKVHLIDNETGKPLFNAPSDINRQEVAT